MNPWDSVAVLRGCLSLRSGLRSGPSSSSLCPAHATTEVRESRGPSPVPAPRRPVPSLRATLRGCGRRLRERPCPHRPSESAVQDTLPHASIRCGAARRGRRGARRATRPTVSPAPLRHPGARLPRVGGSRSVPASVGLRARSSARRGSRGRAGRGGAGRGRKRRRRDYETRRAGSRAHAPPPPPGGAEGRGRRPGKPPAAAAPAGRIVGCGPLEEPRARAGSLRTCPLRATLCGAKRNGAPKSPQPRPEIL